MVAKDLAKILIDTFENKGKVLICGNGGSATQSSHFADELISKYKEIRQPLPAIALTDVGVITAIGNDFGFDQIFSRQILALGNKGDLLIAISTSGKSENVNNVIAMAHFKGMQVIEWPRQGEDIGKIQGYQLALMHDTCAVIEAYYANK